MSEVNRESVGFFINGQPARALVGDTVLTSLLTNRGHLRSSDFGDGPRAGFCNMAACQDCWVKLEDGSRLRACSEFILEGMRFVID